MYVCLQGYLSNHTRPNFTKFSVRVAYGRASVLLWWRCDSYSTSGFLDDDVTFSYNGPYGSVTLPQQRRCNVVCALTPLPCVCVCVVLGVL